MRAIICLFLIAGCPKKPELPKEPPKKEFLTQEKLSDNGFSKDEIRLTGQVSARNRSKIGFHVSGFIENVNVRPGDFVKAGAVMAELDARDYQQRYLLAKTNRDKSKLNWEATTNDLARERQLMNEGASTPLALEKITLSERAGKLAYEEAEIALRLAQKSLADTKLKAPFDCRVVRQIKFKGEQVGIGLADAVFEIVDNKPLEIQLEAPVALLPRVKIGDQLQIKLPSQKLEAKAKIVRIVPVLAEATRTFQIIAQFEGPTDYIVPGSFVEALPQKNGSN